VKDGIVENPLRCRAGFRQGGPARRLERKRTRARSHRPIEAVNLTLQSTLSRLFGRKPHRDAAARLYAALGAQARAPVLYESLGVPDTLDGRFDALCLHVALAMRRLGRDPDGVGRTIGQHLYDCMFEDMDASLRELGVGDLGVGKRVREMAEGLMGRIAAYGAALDAPDGTLLEAALRRNLYGTLDQPAAGALATICTYMRTSDAALAGQSLAELLRDGPRFGPLVTP
jgi:cytochrome b pre-mRNA-processing protein 3